MGATAVATGPDILALWPDLVDERTGIIREIVELRIDDDQPAFVHYLSFAASTEAWDLLPNFGNNGGVGVTRCRALRKALGEAVERYCAAIFRPDDLVWASHDELSERALPPEEFALYSPEQHARPGFPWVPFTRDVPVSWVAGRDLVDGEPCLVPAAFVHVPYHFVGARPATPITQPISTGLACGASFAAAAMSALCEVVERDAFTITWQRVLSRPLIRHESLPTSVADAVERFTRVGVEVHLVDITTDVTCPTIMAVAEGHVDSSPAVAVAASSDLDPQVAALKAVEELAHTRRFSSQVMEWMDPVPVDAASGHPAVETQREHLRYYCPQSAKPHSRFLWTSETHTDLGASPAAVVPERGLRRLVDAVASTGQRVVAVDLTTPDVAELGLSVVRVVVPGFHPLQMGHGNRALGGTRLCEVPARIGHDPSTPADNPHPHPFP